MTTIGGHADGSDGTSADRNFAFWITLIVSTMLAAVAVYVLSAAFLDPSAAAPGRHAATVMHARS